MYIDQATLRPYLDEGLITEQRHPQAEYIRIYNYTGFAPKVLLSHRL